MLHSRYRLLGWFVFLIVALITSCRPSKEIMEGFNYFEKHGDTISKIINPLKEPVIQKNDQLNITVNSATLNQEQAQVFNLLNNSQTAGGTSSAATMGYLVDFDGNISLPIIGTVKAAGLTKSELNKQLVQKLSPYIKDPVVNIRFLNFRVMMLGEVVVHGPQTFTNERATIVDAIGQAGGLTDLAMRNNILVIREAPDGSRTTDTLNLNDAAIFGAKSYQLQQNDIVYVSPSPLKVKNINTNPTIYRDIPFIISLLTALLLLMNLFIK